MSRAVARGAAVLPTGGVMQAIGIVFLLSAWAAVADTTSTGCFPPCRPGYLCHEGQCISKCNPPCPEGTDCTDELRCVPLEQPRRADNLERTSHDEVVPSEGDLEVHPVKMWPKPCPRALVIAPVLTEDALHGSFTEEELTQAVNMVATAAAQALFHAQVVTPDEYTQYRGCDCPVLEIRLEEYRKRRAYTGQYEGVLTLVLVVWTSPSDSTGDLHTITVAGEPHWGDTKPMHNAFNSAAYHIRQNAGEWVLGDGRQGR